VRNDRKSGMTADKGPAARGEEELTVRGGTASAAVRDWLTDETIRPVRGRRRSTRVGRGRQDAKRLSSSKAGTFPPHAKDCSKKISPLLGGAIVRTVE
jgi:hypothetical protein